MRILLSVFVLSIFVCSCSTVKHSKRSAKIEISSANKTELAKR